jgi:hypothetical protein
VLDLGVVAPTAFLASVLLIRRAPLGYLLASIILVLLAIIGVVVAAQTLAQTLAGITLSTGEYFGKVGTFVIMSLIAIWLMVRFFRNISDSGLSLASEAILSSEAAETFYSSGTA